MRWTLCSLHMQFERIVSGDLCCCMQPTNSDSYVTENEVMYVEKNERSGRRDSPNEMKGFFFSPRPAFREQSTIECKTNGTRQAEISQP